jgi:protein SCO1/2
MTDPAPSPPRMFPTMMILVIIASLGIVVWWNYYLKIKRDAEQGRLPIKSRVETDPGYWVDQNGQPRKLKELDGKIVVWSYLYTTCPAGCAFMADEMKKLQDEFGSNPKFHLVSVGLYPEKDRPAELKAWVDAKKFGGTNWWFLTTAGGTEADGDAARQWMQKTFNMWATKNSEEHLKKSPLDVWTHPQVMAVTDGHGNIRTPTYNDNFWFPYSEAFKGPAPRPISEDIKKLLEEAEQK